jgi:hypothetical protein
MSAGSVPSMLFTSHSLVVPPHPPARAFGARLTLLLVNARGPGA